MRLECTYHLAKIKKNNNGIPSNIMMESVREQFMGKICDTFNNTPAEIHQLEFKTLYENRGGTICK